MFISAKQKTIGKASKINPIKWENQNNYNDAQSRIFNTNDFPFVHSSFKKMPGKPSH